jgi:hypothetical protein
MAQSAVAAAQQALKDAEQKLNAAKNLTHR